MPGHVLFENPLLLYYVTALAVLLPCIRICRRVGIAPWRVGFLAAPYFGHVLFLAALALRRWPVAGEKA